MNTRVAHKKILHLPRPLFLATPTFLSVMPPSLLVSAFLQSFNPPDVLRLDPLSSESICCRFESYDKQTRWLFCHVHFSLQREYNSVCRLPVYHYSRPLEEIFSPMDTKDMLANNDRSYSCTVQLRTLATASRHSL